jgi:hypothetical protein
MIQCGTPRERERETYHECSGIKILKKDLLVEGKQQEAM